MRVIPQLSTLAHIQFPAISGRETRTLVNRLNGGAVVVYADSYGRRATWRLDYRGLTEDERQALETFFNEVEGRLQPFTFLDPFENLFARSEQFSASEWFKEAPLALTGGASDPEGGSAAFGVANPGAAPLRIYQALGIPGSFQYTLSVYARAATPNSITLSLKTGTNAASKAYTLTTDWKRYAFSTTAGGSAEIVEAGFEIAAGTGLEIFGAQLEAQPAASDYKATAADSGIHPKARLLQDELVWTTVAPGAHDTTLTIAST